MAYGDPLPRREKLAALCATLALCTGTLALLILGLNIAPIVRIGQSVSVIAVPLPLVAPAPRSDDIAESGKAAPPNLHANAAPVEAPRPKITVSPTIPIPAAPKAGSGSESLAGAAPTAGAGSGAGGQGDGLGSGGNGNGLGGGSRPVWRSGTIRDRDYPRSSSQAKRGGEVEVGFTITPSGNVTSCHITKSSGDKDLDTITCKLVEERFRFRPATDAAGETISSRYGWRQSWWLEKR